MKNKAIPLTVTETLLEAEKIIEDQDIRIEVKSGESLMNLECSFADQKFFFTLEKHSIATNNTVMYQYSFMPHSKDHFDATKANAKVGNFKQHLSNWLNLVKTYHEIEEPFKDKFERIYEQQFTDQFKILDDDADTSPYDRVIQEELYKVLNNIIYYLEDKMTEENKDDFEVIIEESKELQSELTTSVKNRVAQNFGRICAKTWKLGIKVFHGALGNIAYDTLKLLIIG